MAKNLLGYVRSTEVTINHEADQPMYHHHMHVLLFMKSSYFTGTDNYISQAEWTGYWQRAMKLDYVPVVNVEAVKPNVKRQKNSLLASAQETAKYQVKSKDILTNNQEQDLQVIDDLEQALAGSRQISYGGLLKEIRKQLQLEDVENGDLINTDSDDQKVDQVVREIVAKWDYQRKNYFVCNFRKGRMTDPSFFFDAVFSVSRMTSIYLECKCALSCSAHYHVVRIIM